MTPYFVSTVIRKKIPVITLAPPCHAVSANKLLALQHSTRTLGYAPNNAHLFKATLEQTAG